MRKGWTFTPFEDVCVSMTKGPFGSDIKKSLYVPKSTDTYKVYIQVNAIEKDASLGDYFISKEYFDSKMSRFEVKPNDYIITCDGTLGRYLRLPPTMERGIISASLLRITLKTNILPRFFEYLWDGYIMSRLTSDIRNSALVHLPSATKIGKVLIPLPSIVEQERIVAELDLLQGIIDKQKAQLKELDTLAQSIFYDMFGDPMQNEKGWEVKLMGEVGTIVSGSTPSTADESNWDGTVNWITPAEMGVQLFYGETTRKITEKAAERLTLMPVGTVLLSSRAPIGKLAITTVPMCCNQGFKNIVCGSEVNNIYLYYFLLLTMDSIIALGRGATFKEVSKQAISAYPVIIPSLSLQQAFADKIEAIERQKSLITQSIAETQKLFDYTMDKYFG